VAANPLSNSGKPIPAAAAARLAYYPREDKKVPHRGHSSVDPR
jgi:hypothetical protein